ncbi:MAG: glycoside hydrolase family 127 protein, partial [Paludibacter sp.]|nr:glycoside hydrolase family 127 protein [Paludibacter sp.]
YISCFCCPPNTVRTLCEAQDYAYSLGNNAVYCNLYGGSQLETLLNGKDNIKLTQTTDYPWDGNIKISLDNTQNKVFSLYLRIPEWCDKATITINAKAFIAVNKANTYTEIKRKWEKGDVVELVLDMPVKLMESNPLVEETRNQTCVKRGPLVYCLEGMDIDGGKSIDDVMIPEDIKFTPRRTVIAGSSIVVLDGTARLANEGSWKNTLYRPVEKSDKSVKITLIPYYAWGNRGKSEMTVWMPLVK